MERTLDKIIIFVASSTIYLCNSSVNTTTLIAILLTIIFSCADVLVNYKDPTVQPIDNTNKKLHLTIIFTIYIVLSLIVPNMFLFLPIILYDIFRYRLKVIGLLAIICLIYGLTQTPAIFVLAEILILLFAILLESKCTKNKELSDELIQLRDTSKEHNLLLEKNQKIILEQQDSMVYMATLKERNRIAREIHDNVGHLLTRSILMVGALKTVHPEPELSAPLETLQNSLDTAMNTIRASVHDLHDDSIDLQSAIMDILNPVEQFETQLDFDAGSGIAKEVKYCFIATVKEAVNNAIKYSDATQMNIIVREHPDFYQLLIKDNGTNINTDHKPGIGLINIKDRVNALNGTINITTDSGFRIFISIMKSSLPESE